MSEPRDLHLQVTQHQLVSMLGIVAKHLGLPHITMRMEDIQVQAMGISYHMDEDKNICVIPEADCAQRAAEILERTYGKPHGVKALRGLKFTSWRK